MNEQQKATLPVDFTREVPAAAWKWLLQYELPFSYWQQKVGYSPSEERLIFPIDDVFSIGRYVGNEDGKRKWYVWGDSHKHCCVIGKGEKIVLVEDIVSAHKVANAGFAAIPLFGVEVHKPHLWYLMQEDKDVVFWLDWDQRGSITKKVMSLQTIINKPVTVVATPKDPKALSIKQIKELVL